MDSANPVVRLCVEGMQAELEGRSGDAHALFRQAWYAATDDYEACVAAHYLARHQHTPEDTLRWNRECLERADRVGDERVRGFYPSLHVAMATAHQELGEPAEAREHYRQAAQRIEDAPPGPYRDGIRFAVAAGLRATGDATPPGADTLAELLTKLCASTNLTALAVLLPPYLGDLGTEADRTAKLAALHMVDTTRALPDDELMLVRKAISEVTAGAHP